MLHENQIGGWPQLRNERENALRGTGVKLYLHGALTCTMTAQYLKQAKSNVMRSLDRENLLPDSRLRPGKLPAFC